ncbi:MAG: PQQ-binding-like beta-propeller repeat protein [Acidobacteriota bacterium]|nr:PQQ-binding-like beta-propeller repeat protein [Acidobacteriota bacterium]MDQ5873583.1 PQQ-binding-like beta-propeller repeat protein [Acidobacteriota bacterium]
MICRFLLLAAIFFSSVPAAAAVHYIKWNHANGSGNDRTVAAIDLESGKVLWEKKLKKEVNFVLGTDAGVLVGSDDGLLHLLRAGDGTVMWTVNLGKEVNEFHKDTGDGFLVSHDKQVYWKVGRDGKILADWK